jgi:hypothetical protein
MHICTHPGKIDVRYPYTTRTIIETRDTVRMYRLKTAFDSWDRLRFSHQDGIIARDENADGDCLFAESDGMLVDQSGDVVHWAWTRKSGTVLTFWVYVEYLTATHTLFRLKIGLPDTYLSLRSGVLSIGEARLSPILCWAED